MKYILFIVLFLVSELSLAEQETIQTEVSFKYSNSGSVTTFNNKDYFYHLFDFTLASDNKNYLLVIEIPRSPGIYRLNAKNVYIADFSKCEQKENGVSSAQGIPQNYNLALSGRLATELNIKLE